jgi:hypothetical protein
MGFLDALKAWTGNLAPEEELHAADEIVIEPDPDFPSDEIRGSSYTLVDPVQASPYDRDQWRKKVKLLLEKLPGSQEQWPDLQQDASALSLGDEWVNQVYHEEFELLVRKVVSDRVVTRAEHRNLDLARELMQIPDPEAERTLQRIVQEAESFFGKKVEGA